VGLSNDYTHWEENDGRIVIASVLSMKNGCIYSEIKVRTYYYIITPIHIVNQAASYFKQSGGEQVQKCARNRMTISNLVCSSFRGEFTVAEDS
jgi:hypothetical protein